jgi:AcrR family transcriptional regulator
MEITEIKYPVGEQNFEKIRKGNYLYVDKTDLVYKLANSNSYAFLSRPRRFGKTLLTSTLHYYFDGRKDLFTGLAMEQLEKDWIQYPVLHFDISLAKDCSPEEMTEELHKMLNEYDNIYGIHTTSTPGSRLSELIRHIYHTTGKQVVILIDEYDAPVMKVLHKKEIVKEIRERMSNFYTALKPNDRYLRFVFITGVSTFSQMGIFSELNNLKKISDDDRYAAICGITEQELRDNFAQGISSLAERKKCSREEILAILKDKYDGYHFSESLIDIYNPFSLLNAFDMNKIDDYWFDSGTSSSLLNAFRQYVGEFNLELDKIDSSDWMEPSDFRKSLEDHASIIPLLYQTGYLTIKDYDGENEQYKLGMPNAEVRVGLLKNLLPLHISANGTEVSAPAGRASTALRKGDINQAMEILRSLLKSLPYGKNESKKYHDMETTEQYYQDLYHFFFSMMCNLVNSEVRNSTGATDVIITTPMYIYVVEIKIDSTPEVALSQIDEKGYAVPYLTGPRKVIKVGVNFSTEEKTLSDWKVMEA